jgi:hypothetical protein
VQGKAEWLEEERGAAERREVVQAVDGGDDEDEEDERDDDPPVLQPPTEADIPLFIDALTALGGKAGNQALRQRLGWTEDRYARVKRHLIAVDVILPGPGRGGSVRFA